MLDCSRNAVRTVESVKRFIDELALMGYNQLLFYAEDMYEIKNDIVYETEYTEVDTETGEVKDYGSES